MATQRGAVLASDLTQKGAKIPKAENFLGQFPDQQYHLRAFERYIRLGPTPILLNILLNQKLLGVAQLSVFPSLTDDFDSHSSWTNTSLRENLNLRTTY